MYNLILASSSLYRQQLLAKLNIDFSHTSPEIDEIPRAHETAEQLASRLAIEKAKAVASQHPQSLIIGSDQVASINNQLLFKPGNHEQAVKQLKLCSGKKVSFYTSVCLLNSHTGKQQVSVEVYTVCFRELTTAQIERYLQADQPYDCAGSFKMEGLGISLFTSIKGEDPNTLIGLPLIRLIEMLGNEGICIP